MRCRFGGGRAASTDGAAGRLVEQETKRHTKPLGKTHEGPHPEIEGAELDFLQVLHSKPDAFRECGLRQAEGAAQLGDTAADVADDNVWIPTAHARGVRRPRILKNPIVMGLLPLPRLGEVVASGSGGCRY